MGQADEAAAINRNGPVHVYVQVADLLQRSIETGHLRPGDRLSSEKEIQDRFDVGRQTARSATRLLRDRGVVFTVPHRGTFISDPRNTG
jgi:GntR family transcriptional regulator